MLRVSNVRQPALCPSDDILMLRLLFAEDCLALSEYECFTKNNRKTCCRYPPTAAAACLLMLTPTAAVTTAAFLAAAVAAAVGADSTFPSWCTGVGWRRRATPRAKKMNMRISEKKGDARLTSCTTAADRYLTRDL